MNKKRMKNTGWYAWIVSVSLVSVSPHRPQHLWVCFWSGLQASAVIECFKKFCLLKQRIFNIHRTDFWVSLVHHFPLMFHLAVPYRVSLVSCHWAWEHCYLESLYPLGHPTTAVALRDMIKGMLFLLLMLEAGRWGCMQKADLCCLFSKYAVSSNSFPVDCNFSQ